MLTFLERLSHNALLKNRKRETLDACMLKVVGAVDVRPLAFTDSPHNIVMLMFTAVLELSFLFDCLLAIANVASLITARKSLSLGRSSSESSCLRAIYQ